MNEILSKRSKLRKGVSIFALVATVLVASGGAALAVAPADFGLTEGDTISANNLAGDPDVYIVNEHGFKRLFLNPVIFGFYGHLGFDKVKSVSASTRDAFVTSGLFRNCEAGDLRVYGVETTGEDTGVLHWVNMTGSQAVAEDADFFKKVFCINNNEWNWYTNNGVTFGSDYTALSQVPDYARGETGNGQVGPITVSLAPGSPAARTVTLNAQGVEVLRVRLQGSGTLSGLTVTRGGAGQNSDVSNVYLYDGNTRLTSARSINTSTGKVQFVNLGLAVNGTRDLSVVVDFSSATAGNVHNFSVATAADAMLAGAVTAGGSYPVTSSNLSISGAPSGTLTIEKAGSLSNPSVGQQNALITEFKLTTATEAGLVKRVRFIQNGTVADANINNIVVKTLAGVQVGTGTMTGDGYMDLVFTGNGYNIVKGDDETFQVFANLGGKKDETIDLYVEIVADVLAVGDQFGFGMAVSNSMSTASQHLLTLRGGDLTLAFNGPSATNIGTDTQDTHFIDFSVSAASGIELKQHDILICADIAGDGTFDSLDTNFSDLEDIKIINVDTGVTLVGPVDGSTFGTASASCPGGADGLKRSSVFTDAFDILAGQTLNLALTADVQNSNSADTESELVDGSVVRITLESYADQAGANGSLSVARYVGTNTAVAAAQIVPSGDLTSNNMTISATGLTLGLAGSPVSKSVVKGTQGVDVLGATFKASLAGDVTIKKVTLTGQSGTDSGTVATANIGGLVDSVTLWDGDTGAALGGTVISSTLASDGKIQFDNLNWSIPAGETKTLLVKANLSGNNVPTNDVFAFDIAAAADVTALDNSGQTVTVSGNDFNIATNTSTVDITVTSAGTLSVATAPATPTTRAFYWGQSGAEASRFRFTSVNEGFYLEKLTFGASGANATEKTDLAANAKSVTVEYTNKAGSTLTQTQLVTGGASVNFGFTGTARPYVPKDSSIDVVVKVNLKTNAEGATTTNIAGTNRFFSVDYMDTFNGSEADGFRAIGEGSSTLLTGASAGVGTEVAGNNMYVYRVFPRITAVSTTAGEPLGTKDVLRFNVEAMGLTDSRLLFDGGVDDASGSIVFEAVADPTTSASALNFTVYDESDGSVVDTGTYTEGTPDSINASLSVNFGSKDIEIEGGQSKTFRVEMQFVGFTTQSDFFQLILRDEAGTVNWVDTTGDVGIPNVAGVLRQLPLNGPIFSKL